MRLRLLNEIADEIADDWPAITPRAAEWLADMETLETVNDAYYEDTARVVVVGFLEAATGWQSEISRAIKDELRNLLYKPALRPAHSRA